MSYIHIETELPRITVVRLDDEPDTLDALCLSFKEGHQKLKGDHDTNFHVAEVVGTYPHVNPENLSVVGSKLVVTTFSGFNPNRPHVRVLAHSTDFAVWNQTGDTYIVSPVDGEWTNNLIPEGLLKLVPKLDIHNK
jgi:hypothetical protein